MKNNMQKAQDELKDMRIEVLSNDELIEIILDGNKNTVSLKIADSLLSEEKDLIEDILISAMNKANKEADIKIKEKMTEATGGMMPNLPGF